MKTTQRFKEKWNSLSLPVQLMVIFACTLLPFLAFALGGWILLGITIATIGSFLLHHFTVNVRLEGIVEKLRFSTNTSGMNYISTQNITIFEITGTPCEIISDTSIPINNGDYLEVTGTASNGFMKIVAYKNQTNGVTSKNWQE